MIGILNLIESSGPGGAENIMLALANHQKQLGYFVTVGLQRKGWVSNRVDQLGLELIVKPLTSSIDINWLKQMYQYVKHHNIKLIHSHEFAMNLHGTILSKLTGIPCITSVHGKKYYPDKLQRRLILRFISRYSNLVAVSGDLKDFLIDEIGLNPLKIEVLPNGVDLKAFEQSESIRRSTRLQLGLDDNKILVGAIGNLYPVKGHAYLLEAAALVIKQLPNVTFMIVGRGKLEKELKAKATSLGIQNNVLFLGFRDDVKDLLQAMDVFVMSSLSEGLPVSILEAMASKTPVVSTDVGGISEVIKNEVTGYLVEAKSAESLAEGLINCIEKVDLKITLINNAFKLVSEKHSLSSMFNEYEELYKKLI